MRSDYSVLALGFTNGKYLRAQSGPDLLGPQPRRAAVPEPDDLDVCLRGIEAAWSDDVFWCKERLAHGFPLFFVHSCERKSILSARIEEAGGDAGWLSYGLDQARACLHLRPQIVAVRRMLPALTYHTDLTQVCRVIRYGAYNSGRKLLDAYTDFVRSPVARTEETWGVLGAYPWHDLDRLLAGAKRAQYDAAKDRRVAQFFSRLWGRTGAAPKDRRTRASAAMAYGDAFLWERLPAYKRRHYYDVATLLILMDEVWGNRAVAVKAGMTEREAASQAMAYRRAVRMVLSELVFGPAGYERLYLSIFWIFTTRWWPSLVPCLLRMGTLGMADADYTACHKEMTAVITATWMVPGTVRQHQFSAVFLNSEDLVGWSDRDSLKGDVCAEIIRFALAQFHYRAGVVAGGGGEREGPIRPRSEEEMAREGPREYLRRFEDSMYELLRPMYAAYGDKMQELSDFMDRRMAWAAGGAVGRRAKDVLGPALAPNGAAKAYTAARAESSLLVSDWGQMYIEVGGKGNEKGAERTLCATDLRDQVAESYLLHAFKNKYGLIGVDVGESPAEQLVRHVTIAAASDRPQGYHGRTKPALAAWDYSKWDHHVMLAERLILCAVMRRLIKEYVSSPVVRRDMLRELDIVERGHRTAIYRSAAYADEVYGAKVDEVLETMRAKGARATRLDSDKVIISDYAGQQSGRRSTLESNTFYSRARLLVRDAELHPSRRSVYLLNRADDVLEIYRAWVDARDAIDLMLLQGHKANPKKQVVQVRTGVYFRILYAAGSMRGFPARAVYASATAGPSMGATGGASPTEILSSLSGALDRLARRGAGYWVARHLYLEAEDYYRDVRAQLAVRRGKYVRFQVAREVLRAAPEMGGCGILPPGEYEYDYTVKCNMVRGPQYLTWRGVDQRLSGRQRFPGLDDLQRNTDAMFSKDVGMQVPAEAWSAWRRRWAADRAAQSGRAEILRARAMTRVWSLRRRWHRDKSNTPLYDTWERAPLGVPYDMFGSIWRELQRSPGTESVYRLLKAVSGPPAEGMLAKLWYGLGQDIVAVEGPRVIEQIQAASVLGRSFAADWGWLPLEVREKYLRGHLGPAGSWTRLIPSSFTPWINESVNYVLFQAMRLGTTYRGSHWLLQVRQAITSAICREFVSRRPLLMLH